MLDIKQTTGFKRDLKKALKRGKDPNKLLEVVASLFALARC